jgi:hypothetical protein
MAEIPENQATQQDLVKWFQLTQEIEKMKPLIEQERILRKKIAALYFPNPTEGTNTFELNDGTGCVLKYGHTIERKVDEAQLLAMRDVLAESSISVDDLIRRKPELEKKAYNKLTDEQRALFDQALIIKPGSITLEITLPAKAKK